MEAEVVNILLVEDNPADALLLKAGLGGTPGVTFAITRVETLGAALAQLTQRNFDIVVLDVGLPDSTGLNGLHRIRQAANTTPILLLTGLDDEGTGLAAVQHGAQDYLVKGKVDDRAVARAIRYAIQRKRSEDLERDKKAAEAANEAKDHFLAVLSHELRNPLSAVRPALAMLRKFVPAEALEYLEIAQRNVVLEARLIDDLLDVTRITRGKLELERRPLDLCATLHQAAEVCAADIESRGLRFTIQAQDTMAVLGDPIRLQQVFWNLIKNAVKFTPPEGHVSVRCYGHGDRATVEVTDSGIGIEPGGTERIFNAFEQLERTTTQRFGGLGLGLAIAKAIVEMHNGTIRAHSAGKGQGATFVVELPRLSAAELPPAKNNGQKADAGAAVFAKASRPLRILLVEDHGDSAKILLRLLAGEGHQVRHAGDVRTALDLAQNERFDLVLSDLGLPDGSGHDLLRQLAKLGQHPPAIALSGYGMATDLEKSRDAGFQEHLIKPVNLEALEAAVARVGRQSTESSA